MDSTKVLSSPITIAPIPSSNGVRVFPVINGLFFFYVTSGKISNGFNQRDGVAGSFGVFALGLKRRGRPSTSNPCAHYAKVWRALNIKCGYEL